ncbi:hypothetical protein [Actinomadura litoris]|uniref:hypothetical protein n=1 Tax=Actinomadura litoris TaxID=2678616 RepID=UPI001FA74E34|nr:hypothetical protein [Actinomadura litoris]
MTSTTATAPTAPHAETAAPGTARAPLNYPSRVAEIDGKHVVADEAALSPLSKPGKTVVFRRIRELLLDDDSTLYRCTECPETNERLAKIRFHLRVHNTTGSQSTASAATAKTTGTRRPKKTANPATAPDAGTATANSAPGTVLPDLTLAELASRLHELAELDVLRAENTALRVANARLEAECENLRTGHDELLAAMRGMPALVRRAEATEKLVTALHTAIHDLQESA